jgi:hypothetical protein
MENSQKKRKIMIGTPSYDGKVDAWYVHSLIQTIKMSYEKNVDIVAIWVSYDALIQRARNDTIHIAKEMEVDDLVFIDSDIDWEATDFFKLIEHDVDVVGGTYRKKTDEMEIYPVFSANEILIEKENGLIEVEGLGTGFLRFSKKAIDDLYNSSDEYEEVGKGKRRLVFDIGIDQNKRLVSEDIVACLKLRNKGYKIYLDATITCGHTGTKRFEGDFKLYLEKMKNLPKEISESNKSKKDDDIIL